MRGRVLVVLALALVLAVVIASTVSFCSSPRVRVPAAATGLVLPARGA